MKNIRKSRGVIKYLLTLVIIGLSLLGQSAEILKKVPDVQVWCVQNEHVLLFKIKNNSKVSIYIPKNYILKYDGYSGIAHFESTNSNAVGIRKYFYYSVFGEPVKTLQAIKGMKHDSSTTEERRIAYYDFSPPEMIKLDPTGSITLSKSVILARGVHMVTFKYYHKLYVVDAIKDNSKYHSLDNFIDFDHKNSLSISTELIQGEP